MFGRDSGSRIRIGAGPVLGTAITVAAIATLAVGAKALARRIAASRSGNGGLILRGIEVVAAALVLVFGLALLAGYMASERMFT